MSTTATPSPLPIRPANPEHPAKGSAPTTARPHPKPSRPTTKLLLKINDLSTPGAQDFFSSVNALQALQSAVTSVLTHLYPSAPTTPTPGTRSVTLVLRSMDGVAYTTGKDIDDDHKEVHFSTSYIEKIPAERKKDEILGVITHEMVHCWQWNAQGTAPGGLIEGVADWVRLKAGLAPPHWKREAGGDWDAGYQHTGYFLDFLEGKYGEGSVRRVNDNLRDCKYEEEKFWNGIFGHHVGNLWEEYEKKLNKEKEVEEEPIIVEKDGDEETATDERKPEKKKRVKSSEEKDVPSYLV
ncbi:MAG: hypothetical protein M1830_008946 [Pleopsidium flavum]|nr:MAG: hypothetical protein M1830_008946 [Pleopsidium flavum]